MTWTVYDALGRVTESYDEQNGKTAYTYDKNGNRLTTTDAMNHVTTNTYNVKNQLATVTYADGGVVSYTYSLTGKALTTTDQLKHVTTNDYDELDRSKNTTDGAGTVTAYTYDPLGVRVKNVQVRTNANAGHANSDLIDGSNSEDYSKYLSDGRATTQPTWETEVGTVTQNNLETVTLHYTVDYLSTANRDIMVTADGQHTTRYVYDEDGTRVSAEYTYADNTQSGKSGENPASEFAATDMKKVWYRSSLLGSSLFAVNKDGTVISHTIYDAWGNPQTATTTDMNYSGIDNKNNYTGYTWDETLALYYAQNRFYDSTTHRFMQEDSTEDGGNWYVYCGDSPTMRTDVNGNTDIPIDLTTGLLNLPTLQTGSRDSEYTIPFVTILQTALHSLGFDIGAAGVDGIFGSGQTKSTMAAVKAFQGYKSLGADGIVAIDTWNAIINEVLTASLGKVNDYFPTLICPLKSGSIGDNVKYLQKALNYWNINVGSVDGKFGSDPKSGTLWGVNKFKTNNHLSNSGSNEGVVGQTTWSVLRYVTFLHILGLEDIVGNNTGTSSTDSEDVDTSSVSVSFTSDCNSSVVNAKAIKILKIALKKSGNTSAIITSTIRTPEAQAGAMYDNIVKTGPDAQKAIYKAPGQAVVDAYTTAKNAGKSKKQIIQAMVDKINALWPQRVSLHVVPLAEYAKLNVFDVSQNSISKKTAFKAQLDSMKSTGTIQQDFEENGCYHIEVPIK